MEITKQLVEYIKTLKITYNTDSNCIYFNNEPADEYSVRVLCERIKNLHKIELTKEELIDILLNNGNVSIVDKDTTIDEFFELIDQDNTIAENDWNAYKSWRENEALWHTDKDGIKTSIIDCFDNIVGFIEHFPKTRGRIKFNKIRNIVEFNGVQITDNDYHTIMNYITKYFLSTFGKLRTIKDACDNVANKNKFNPWTDYFDKLKYVDDGIDWIDYTIKNVLCCEEQEKYYNLYYETLKIMLLANMSRIYNKELYNKPTKYDTVVALCGVNGGSGKTTFFERLYDIEDNGHSYCYVVAGDSFQPKDRDFIERSHQSVCLFLDEVSMKRAIVTSVKGYITQQDDRFRKAYGYNSEPHMRGFIITASSNNTDILKDYTTDNERRWAIIKISEDENNYIKVNKAFDEGYRDKIWAFIKNIYDQKEYKLYMTDVRLKNLEKDIQRGYKASNNEDYDTIVNDLLEREYGFYDKEYIDADAIVAQYKYGDSLQWCKEHNVEIHDKTNKSSQDKYTMKPEDRLIEYWGKIDRIQKTVLYEIISKIKIEFTKPSLAAEMRVSGRWNGYDNKPCRIAGNLVKGYWRKEKVDRTVFDEVRHNDGIDKSNDYIDKSDDTLPF